MEYRVVETLINGKETEPVIGDSKFLETQYETDESDDGSKKITVTNVYVPDTEISLEAVKLFENGELNEENVFSFEVSEKITSDTGKEIQRHVMDGATKDGTKTETGSKGKIEFEPIKYSLDDLRNDDGSYEQQKFFHYVIKEKIPYTADKNGFDSKSNIQYDTAERNATVTLKLDGGKLDASVEYEDGDTPEFTNSENPTTPPPTPETPPEKPKKPHKPGTGDESDIMLYTMLMLLSLGAMAAAAGSRKRKNTRS